jgi:hypothetical protein
MMCRGGDSESTLIVCVHAKYDGVTAGYLSFHPIIVSLQFSCWDLSVRKKAWRSRARGAKVT